MSTLNLTLMTDLYEMTMMQGYFKTQNHEVVVFELSTATIHVTADMQFAQDSIRSLNISRTFISMKMILPI